MALGGRNMFDSFDPEYPPFDTAAFPFSSKDNVMHRPFLSWSDTLLSSMIDRMPESQRDWARLERKSLRARGLLTDSGFLWDSASKDLEAIRLLKRMIATVTAWLMEFINMSTLDDTPPDSSARAIYDLGRFVAYQRHPFLKCLTDATPAVESADTVFSFNPWCTKRWDLPRSGPRGSLGFAH